MVAVDVSNKGLGPAIVGAVRYEIGDREAAGTYAIDDALREVWPELELYTWQNGTLDSTVVSPGETTRILTLVLPRAGRNDSLPRSLNEYVEDVENLIRPDFCYCSVYGRRWAFRGRPQPPRSAACEAAFAGG